MIAAGASVGVVGGGLLGLTVALRLAEGGRRVTLFETAPALGGLAAAWTIPTTEGQLSWDRYYHVTLESDAALRGLLDDVGLDATIRWATTSTGYLAGGRLSPLSTPREFLALPGLSPVAKVRLALTLARGTTVKNWRALERMPVEQWLTRWSGRATFRAFWVPLLEAKLGPAWREANAAFIWATIQRLTAARRAGIGNERFGAVPGGYGRVTDALASSLRSLGVTVHLGTRVVDVVEAGGGGVGVRTASGTAAALEAVADTPPHPNPDGSTSRFDHVVLTTTPRAAAALLPALAPAARSRMDGVRYQGVICASVVLREPLTRYYLTYLMDDLPFTAIVEMTALIPREWVGGHTLVYLPRYCAPDDPGFAHTDDELAAEFLAGLRRVHPLGPADVLAVKIARTREVFPVPTLGYSETVPPMNTGLPGVSLVSSAQIVNGTLNVNEAVELGERSVAALVGPGPTAS